MSSVSYNSGLCETGLGPTQLSAYEMLEIPFLFVYYLCSQLFDLQHYDWLVPPFVAESLAVSQLKGNYSELEC